MIKQRTIFYRVGAIGDVVHCLPTVKLYRHKNPDAQIEFIVGTRYLQELLQNSAPYIDQVHVADKNFKNNPELKESFKNHKVTEFIYLHSNWWKAWFWNLTFIKASRFLSYKKDISIGAVENFALTCFPELKHIFLDASKSNFANLDFKTLSPTQAVIDAGSEATKSNSKEGDNTQKYICIVPGVGSLRPNRAYPLALWIELIEQIMSKTDLQIKILGGPDEEVLSEKLNLLIGSNLDSAQINRIQNLIGKTSLLDLTNILSKSEMLYSADTGILHIASALGVRVVSLYSITSEYRTGPYTPASQLLRSKSCVCKVDNSNSKKGCDSLEKGYAACMWQISPQELFAAF